MLAVICTGALFVPPVLANFALELAARNAFEEFQSCMRQSGSPTSCESQIKTYVARAKSLLTEDSSHNEGRRLQRMYEFLEERAIAYTAEARSSGSAELSERARSLYALLAELRPSEASQFRDASESVADIAGAGDLRVRLERHFPDLRQRLRSNQSIENRSILALRAAVANYAALPSALRAEINEVGDEVDRWLTAYLTWLTANPREFQPSELSRRLAAYRELQALPNPPTDRSTSISRDLQSVARSLNNDNVSIKAALNEAKENWETVNASEQLSFSGSEDRLLTTLEQKSRLAARLSDIHAATEADFPQLIPLLEFDLELLRDQSNWASWIHAFKYLVVCSERSLLGCFFHHQELRPLQPSNVTSANAISAGERYMELLFEQKASQVAQRSNNEAIKFALEIDQSTQGTFMDKKVRGVAVGAIVAMLGDGRLADRAIEVIPSFRLVNARFRGDANLEAVKKRVLDLAEQSISPRAVRQMYASSGFADLFLYLEALPEHISEIDVSRANYFQQRRFDSLFDSQFHEVKVLKEFYTKITGDITFRQYRAYLAELNSRADLMEQSVRSSCTQGFQACRAQGRLARLFHDQVAEQTEAALRANLPVRSRDLRAAIPERDFLVCTASRLATGDTPLLHLEQTIAGLNTYPAVIFLKEPDSSADLLEFALNLISDVTLSRAISIEDQARFNFASGRKAVHECTSFFTDNNWL